MQRLQDVSQPVGRRPAEEDQQGAAKERKAATAPP